MRPADKLQLKAAIILPLVGLARSKQDPVNRGHGAQYMGPRWPGPIPLMLWDDINRTSEQAEEAALLCLCVPVGGKVGICMSAMPGLGWVGLVLQEGLLAALTCRCTLPLVAEIAMMKEKLPDMHTCVLARGPRESSACCPHGQTAWVIFLDLRYDRDRSMGARNLKNPRYYI